MKIKRWYRQYGTYVVVVAMMGIFFVGAQQQFVVDQLHAWKVLPQPEGYTELYFTNHQALPKTQQQGAALVRFTVGNNEHQAFRYTYRIVQTQAGGAQTLLASRSFTLADGAHLALEVPVTLSNTTARTQIRVELLPGSQQISYWMEAQ